MRLMPRIYRTAGRVDPVVRAGLRACCRGEADWPVLLLGTVGGGKTCAALTLCDYTIGRVRFRTAVDLTERLIDAKCGRLIEWTFDYGEDTRVTPRTMWNDWADADLCVIDDVGQREQVSDTAYEAMKTAIDRREAQPLVVTSNMDLGQIAGVYDDRIASRLAAGTVLVIDGLDRRIDAAGEAQTEATDGD